MSSYFDPSGEEGPGLRSYLLCGFFWIAIFLASCPEVVSRI